MAENVGAEKSGQTAPIGGNDFLTPEITKKIERSIKHAVGSKSEAVIMEYGDPRSIFTFTTGGVVCGNCGKLHDASDPQFCDECGASHIVSLIIGFK